MVQIIDDTQNDIVKFIEHDFGPGTSRENFTAALIDWLHYRARLIPRRPRQVLHSKNVSALIGQYPAITNITHELRMAGDLSPWQSNTIEARKSDPRADLMFNDWQITHFHLGQIFATPRKIRRTSDLLFAYIAPDFAVLLDVAPHGSWALRNFLRILLNTKPNVMTPLKGIVGMERQLTDEEYLALRQSGVNAIIEIDGKFYLPPGLGVASSRHADRIVMYADNILRSIRTIKTKIEHNNLPIEISKAILSNMALPIRLGVDMQDGGFLIYDKNRNLGLVQLGCIA